MGKPGSLDRLGSAIASDARRILGVEPALPVNWRERLPEPSLYFAEHLVKLEKPDADGFALASCPFHENPSPSFRVMLTGRGLWSCYAGCGQGDMVKFHQLLTGLSFKPAVRDLLGMR